MIISRLLAGRMNESMNMILGVVKQHNQIHQGIIMYLRKQWDTLFSSQKDPENSNSAELPNL